MFEKRRAEIEAHNARTDKSWVAAVNKFADFTDIELNRLMGYRRDASWRPASQATSGGSSFAEGSLDGDDGASLVAMEGVGGSFLEVKPRRARHGLIAQSMDWRGHLAVSTADRFTREQGGCGSCWAVAAVGALETHAELANLRVEPLSYEQLVDCTPNPQHCGGDGGCKGATGELAMEWSQRFGVVPASMYRGYQHNGDGLCRTFANHRTGLKSSGFTRLKENNLEQLLSTLSNIGPAVVSVDASSWSPYQAGVFDGCQRQAVVNHAVLMVGYGYDRDLDKKYWLIRNSWGPTWGEGGFIRLQRHDAGIESWEAGFCGWDKNPKEGVGCDGGPSRIPVCGMCGVLSDSSYPVGVKSNHPTGNFHHQAHFSNRTQQLLRGKLY